VIENHLETIEMRTHAAKIFGDLNFADSGTTLNEQRYRHIGMLLITLMKATADSQLQMVKQLRDKARIAKGGSTSDITNLSLIASTAPEPFTPEQQLEVTGAVQSVKSNILNVTYGMRGTRLTGAATAGVLPMFTNTDDPVAAKMNATVKLVVPLFKVLDEGPPEDTTKQRLTSRNIDPMDEISSGSSSRTTTKPKDDKPQLRVNFKIIHDALQKMNDELSAIIAGSGS
jgi:hypothetical protein